MVLKNEGPALHFIQETYKHCKTIAATGAGGELLRVSALGREGLAAQKPAEDQLQLDEGVIIGRDLRADDVAEEFIKAIAQHRHWSREMKDAVPA
jgi:catalase